MTYREAFQSTILPSFERACHNMFQQINDSFHKGTQQCMLILLVCLFVCFFFPYFGFFLHLFLKSICNLFFVSITSRWANCCLLLTVLMPNSAFLVCRGSISGEFGLAMVCILARSSPVLTHGETKPACHLPEGIKKGMTKY